MRNVHTQSAAIASRSPSENAPSAEGQRCNTVAVLPRFPHRRHNTEATWKAARSWLTLAYPRGLDSALAELQARLPELAENIARLEQAAQREAERFENTADADMSGFLTALGPWEKATLDGLAALATKGTHA